MNKQKILLIGGAGFIGSHLTEKLKKLGHGVVIVDKGVEAKPPKGDSASLRRKPDVVYHLAGAINLRKNGEPLRGTVVLIRGVSP